MAAPIVSRGTIRIAPSCMHGEIGRTSWLESDGGALLLRRPLVDQKLVAELVARAVITWISNEAAAVANTMCTRER